jgi:replicative DNA helicase
MLVLSEARVEIDGLTVKDALSRANELDAVHGPAYLFSSSDGVPRSANAAEYARIVRDKSGRRQLIHAGQKMNCAGVRW